MQEDDLKTVRQALESYLKLLASGAYTGESGVVVEGDSVTASFQHLSASLQFPNQAAYYWAGKLLRGLEEVGYFWSTDWQSHPFDVPQPQLAETYAIPGHLTVRTLA